MAKFEKGFLNFSVFFSLLVLIPSAMLLLKYIGDLTKSCAAAENTVLFSILLGCMTLLSLMSLVKGLLMD